MSDLTSTEARQLVVEAVEAAAEVIAADATAERWDQPSALDGMTVGALSAHLVRAAGATIAYLDRTPVDAAPDGLVHQVFFFILRNHNHRNIGVNVFNCSKCRQPIAPRHHFV